MIIDVKIPPLGESVTYAELASWLVENGDYVEKDQEIAEVDSDKATLPLSAEESGVIEIIVEEGSKLEIGDLVCKIDTSKKGEAKKKSPEKETEAHTEKKEEKTAQEEKPKPAQKEKTETSTKAADLPDDLKLSVSPLAKKILDDENMDVNDIIRHKLLRITRGDVEAAKATPRTKVEKSREEHREKMSPLRRKLAGRLVKSKNESAMLTTFNEVDLLQVINLRKKYQKQFQEKHGIKVGFMSFFAKAVAHALDDFPAVNASLENDEIIYHDYKDIGIAVSTPKGLMVPVIRNAESLTLAELEHQIMDLATKARNKRITIEEMTGGTFTITNGGVFGSMLSTPIINPPQVAILGMHNIQERPVAIDGKVEIRPMMYIALSYDHRIIDGKESVSFLVRLKELLEEPTKLLTGNDPFVSLLDL